MAVSSQQATPSTAQIVIEILELLDAHTDREHGITATEISKRISVSEKTVRGHLKALRDMQPFGRRVWSIWSVETCSLLKALIQSRDGTLNRCLIRPRCVCLRTAR